MDLRRDTQRRYGRTVEAERFSEEGLRPDPGASAAAAADGGVPSLPGRRATRRFERGADGPQDARFSAEGLLGVGATGQVYSVLDRNLERLVAVKVLLPELLATPDEVAGFVREARITAALAHPNVLPVHDFDLTEDGRPYIAMARIQGRSLGTLLCESAPGSPHAALPSRNALVSMAIAVCNAAAFAHHQGIVHQDIKPDNIMLGDFGEVLLVDWGSAGRVDAAGRVAGQLYGTPVYMSPEQARRECADRRSDVYCIGASLFHALTLRLACWTEDSQRYWEMKRRGDIDRPTAEERAGVPAELLAIVLKAMAADPAARYQTAEDLRHDLEQYQAGLAVSAHRESPWRRFRRWHRRNTKAFWASAAALTAMAALGWMVVADKLKEYGGWTLVRAEDFTGDGRGFWSGTRFNGWTGKVFEELKLPDAGHRLELRDGGLVISGGDDLIAVANRDGVIGDLAVEWDYRPLGVAHDLNCFIGGADRYHAFTFHVGGFGQPGDCTLTRGEVNEFLCQGALPRPMRIGETYHLRIERASRHVRLWFDGSLVVDWFDAEDLGGGLSQRFGFDCIPNQQLWVGSVRLFRRELAQRILPLEVGDRLFQLDRWSDAEQSYREIRDAYPGTDLATRAEFRLLLARWRRGEPGDIDEALDGLGRFAREQPGHELAPYALAYRAHIARARGAAAVGALREARTGLARYRGHPLLAGMLRRIGDDLVAAIGDAHGIELVEKAEAVHREMQEWSRVYGLPVNRHPSLRMLDGALNGNVLHREVLRLAQEFPESVALADRAEALAQLGRCEEALALLRDEPAARAWIGLFVGRLREAADEERADLYSRASSLYWLGEFAAMRRLAPRHQLVDDLLIYEGRYPEYFALHPSDEFGRGYGMTPRMRALIASGQGERVLVESDMKSTRIAALIALGRVDEAEALASEGDGTVEVAIARAARGELGRAIAICPNLEAGPFHAVQNESALWRDRLARVVLLAASGERSAALAALEKIYDQRDGDAWPLRDCAGQGAWHLVGYALGRCDDSAFRAQPRRFQVEARLLLAQALRFELTGAARAAAERWRAFLALPHWQRDTSDAVFVLACWRIRAAGLELPSGPLMPTIGLCFR